MTENKDARLSGEEQQGVPEEYDLSDVEAAEQSNSRFDSDIEPRGSDYPQHAGGEKQEITLSAVQNDWLIEFIKRNQDGVDAAFSEVCDDVFDKLDFDAYNHRPPSTETLAEVEVMAREAGDD